jgi:outer membrane protein OmpA-like peptidoglycan-associated protein
MNRTRRVTAALFAVFAVAALVTCGPRRIRTPDAAGSDLVLLLPDSDGTIGRVAVSNSSASVDLDAAREYTSVSANQPPASPAVMSEADVQRLFGVAISTLPPPPEHFTLHFRFESDELTDDSRVLLGRILDAVRKRPASEVAVIGHTDTAGTPASNFELGLKRAQMIHKLLVGEGLDSSLIEVTSHGEGDPLVPTADEVLEPRNRRVEISIR